MRGRSRLELGLRVLVSGADARTPPGFADGKDLERCRSVESRWLHHRGVQGIAVARRRESGLLRRELALVVYVERKRPLARLARPVPAEVSVPDLGRLPTDVVEIGRILPCTSTTPMRPARPGCSVGHLSGTGGTMGPIVVRQGATTLFFVGCAHVLAPRGQQSLADAVYQPAPSYEGHRRIGTLCVTKRILYSSAGWPNLVDAALVEIDDPAMVTPELREIGEAPSLVHDAPPAGAHLRLIGQASDLSHCTVEAAPSYVALHYPRRAGFQQQILCNHAARPGDSGGIAIDEEGRIVGLVIGASESRTVVTPWRFLRGAFSVRLA